MPATADPVVGLRERLALERLGDQRADVVGELLELGRLGRVVGDVALGVADGARLQRGVEADLGPVADHELGRAAADVDDERLVAGGRSAQAPR